jgi:hypothetical protein
MKMLKHKVGDTVRIQTREWMDTQKKDKEGSIYGGGSHHMNSEMQQFAGGVYVIGDVLSDGVYRLESRAWRWEDWMFDPNYLSEDEPLSVVDAIVAMVQNKEKLYDEEKHGYVWDSSNHVFVKIFGDGLHINEQVSVFDVELYRRPAKCTRYWTRWQILAWANSKESRGWLVKPREETAWYLPQFHAYNLPVEVYQRAKLLSDLSGIDEDTIQGFEVEE